MAERTVKREYKPVPDYRPGDPGANPFNLALAVRIYISSSLSPTDNIFD